MTENAVCLAVLSDVHGNLPALQAVSDDRQQYGVNGIIAADRLIAAGIKTNEKRCQKCPNPLTMT